MQRRRILPHGLERRARLPLHDIEQHVHHRDHSDRRQHEAPAPRDRKPLYRETTEDRFWYWLYLPVARLVERVTALVTVLQRGRISVYLMYSFATLLLLLLFIR